MMDIINKDCIHISNTMEAIDEARDAIVLYHQRKKNNRSSYRSFIMHKPIGVITSRVDPTVTNIVRKEAHPLFGKPVGGESRISVYDIALRCGFPIDVGLVGRLDCETSGIMMFTDDYHLGSAVRDPVDESSPLWGSKYKSKEYLLQLNPMKSFFDVSQFDASKLEAEMSEPLSFSRNAIEHYAGPANIKVMRVWRSDELSYGRENLGWVVDVSVVINEGKHHQIRRLASRSGYRVVSLCRTKVAHILSLSSIPNPGDCRWLTKNEIDELYEAFGLSDDDTNCGDMITSDAAIDESVSARIDA